MMWKEAVVTNMRYTCHTYILLKELKKIANLRLYGIGLRTKSTLI